MTYGPKLEEFVKVGQVFILYLLGSSVKQGEQRDAYRRMSLDRCVRKPQLAIVGLEVFSSQRVEVRVSASGVAHE